MQFNYYSTNVADYIFMTLSYTEKRKLFICFISCASLYLDSEQVFTSVAGKHAWNKRQMVTTFFHILENSLMWIMGSEICHPLGSNDSLWPVKPLFHVILRS